MLVLLVGLWMMLRVDKQQGVEFYGTLIFLAGLLWVLAALVYANINELPGETSGGGNAVREAIERLDLLVTDRPFRTFVIARSLLLCSALTAPFYVVLAQDVLGTDLKLLALFILANGVASSISAPVWGRMADTSSRRVMVIAALITSLLGIGIYLIVQLQLNLAGTVWLYPLAFFLLGVAHSGVRLGRKTYVVDMAGGSRRTDYVAVSNTVIGLVLLLTGGISALASTISPQGVIFVLSLFGLAGAWISWRLPELDQA